MTQRRFWCLRAVAKEIYSEVIVVGIADPSKELLVALAAVKAGAGVLGGLFNLPTDKLQIAYKKKDGDTPVSIIDYQVGDAMHPIIRRDFPDDEIMGEEQQIAGNPERRWVLDELDGTSNVMAGLPNSVVGLAVEKHGEIIVAAVGNPFENSLIFAEKGKGAWETTLFGDDTLRAQRISVRKGVPFNRRFVLVDSLLNFQTAARKGLFVTAMGVSNEIAMNMRSFGSSILHWALVAQGRAHIAIVDAVGGWQDIAPGVLLIEEAGGTITNIHGKRPQEGDQVVIASSGEDHDSILEILQYYYLGYKGFRYQGFQLPV